MNTKTGDTLGNVHNRTLLICDDSIDEIRVIVARLRSANYKLIIARNGKEACDRAGVLQPDLILMEVRMPVMDGLAACRLLKAHPDTRHIPVMFLTAIDDVSTRLEGLRSGAVDYIVKPAHEEEVMLRVAVQIARVPHLITRDCLTPIDSHAHATVTAFVRLLERHYSEGLDIDTLASMVGAHRNAVSEAFREVHGCSVFTWIREQRMKRACEWLTRSSMSVSEIATELGFSSSGNFATAFKDRYNFTPRDFRRLAMLTPDKAEAFWTGGESLAKDCNPWYLIDRTGSSTEIPRSRQLECSA